MQICNLMKEATATKTKFNKKISSVLFWPKWQHLTILLTKIFSDPIMICKRVWVFDTLWLHGYLINDLPTHHPCICNPWNQIWVYNLFKQGGIYQSQEMEHDEVATTNSQYRLQILCAIIASYLKFCPCGARNVWSLLNFCQVISCTYPITLIVGFDILQIRIYILIFIQICGHFNNSTSASGEEVLGTTRSGRKHVEAEKG